MAEKLEYDLLIKGNDLLSGLDAAIKKSGTLETALGAALGIVGANAINKGFELIGSAISSAVGFAKDSVKAFSEQEDAINKLGQALRASGEFSNAAVDDFVALGSAIQQASIYGDELVVSQLAVAKSFGASNEQAKNLVQAAANLSATFGGSLESNVEKLGKTLGGTTGRLAQYIPELKSLTAAQLAAGAAADIVNKKFEGAAASQLDTYSGKVQANANSFSDLQEELGRLLAKNSLTTTFLSGTKAGFDLLTTAVKGTADALGIGITPIQAQKEKLSELGTEYNRLQGIITATKKNIEFSKNSGSDELQNVQRIADLSALIAQAETKQTDIIRQRVELRKSMREDKEVESKPGNTEAPVDKGALDARAKLNAQLIALDEQLELERETAADAAANRSIQSEQIRNEEELQRQLEYEAQKQEIEFGLKEAEIARMEDGESQKLAAMALAKEKEIALIKNANNRAEKESALSIKNKAAIAKSEIALEEQKQAAILGIIGATANLASAVAKDGSKEQFFIQKAAATAQAVIAMNTAAIKGLAIDPTGSLTAYAYAQGAINIAAIAATAIKGYATGGIIGGEGAGASIGPDDQTINARKGEMMLNADDQKFLFDFVKGKVNGQDTTIMIDGVAILKALRKVKNQGYVF